MRRRGFTLIEILVSIAVIGVLMGLALPALVGSREAARRAACMANLKSMGGAMGMYLNQHDVIPFAEFGVDLSRGFDAPLPALAEHLEVEPPGWDSATGEARTAQPWLCPSDQDFAPRIGWSYVYGAFDLIALEMAHSQNPLVIVTRIFENNPTMPIIFDARNFHNRSVPETFPEAFRSRNVLLLDGTVEKGDPRKHLVCG